MDQETLKEKAKYDLLWSETFAYRACSPGEAFAPLFIQLFRAKIKPGQTIIDFGCGTGRAAKYFLAENLKAILVDFSPHCLDEEIRHLTHFYKEDLQFIESCLWNLPKKLEAGEWIFCCDVLEHIPENHIDEVLKAMRQRMKLGGYLTICFQEDEFGKAINSTLHMTIKDKKWWEEKLSHHFILQHVLTDEVYFNCSILPI